MVGDVEGRHCVLIDDMIDTAGTICAAAELLTESGAADIWAMATHAVLSGPGRRPAEGSPDLPGGGHRHPAGGPGPAVRQARGALGGQDHRRRHRRRLRGHLGLGDLRRATTWPELRSPRRALAGTRPPDGLAWWRRPSRRVRSAVARARRPPAPPSSPRRPVMAEITLDAEVGRPLGSASARRLRHDGQDPGDRLRPRDRPGVGGRGGPRAARSPCPGSRGPTRCSSLKAGDQTFLTLAREMQRHPVRGTVTHVDFQIVRRDEIIVGRRADHPGRRGARGPPRRRTGRPAAVQPARAGPAGRHPDLARGRHHRADHRRARSGWPTSPCPPG